MIVLSTSQFLLIAAKGFVLGFSLGLAVLAIRFVRRGWSAILGVTGGPLS